jgi:hypothetical protein
MTRRIVVLRPDGVWEIQGLWEGSCIASPGYLILRETNKAVYFVESK